MPRMLITWTAFWWKGLNTVKDGMIKKEGRSRNVPTGCSNHCWSWITTEIYRIIHTGITAVFRASFQFPINSDGPCVQTTAQGTWHRANGTFFPRGWLCSVWCFYFRAPVKPLITIKPQLLHCGFRRKGVCVHVHRHEHMCVHMHICVCISGCSHGQEMT